jgi:hypothetical protein
LHSTAASQRPVHAASTGRVIRLQPVRQKIRAARRRGSHIPNSRDSAPQIGSKSALNYRKYSYNTIGPESATQGTPRPISVLQRRVDGVVLGVVSTFFSVAVFLLKRLRTT